MSVKPDMGRSWSKLDELILYIAERCAGDPRFGKIKLNKILFYSDFLAYMRWGKPITGEDYVKQPHGPVPCHLDKRLNKLQGEDLEVIETQFYGKTQHRVIPKREAQLSEFTGAEIALVDDVLERLRDYSGTDVSELSHRFLAWRIANIGERIPYAASLVQRGVVTTEKLEAAEELTENARSLRSK